MMEQLFLISYQGTITTLEFSAKDGLCEISTSRACQPSPSWITLDTTRRILYCTEAGMVTGTGALKAFRIQPDGTLVETSSVPTPKGAAHLVLYNNSSTMAVAYYYAGYVGTYDVSDPNHLRTIQEITFEITPGPGAPQDQSRPHNTIIDPSGRYLLVPDLGADLIRAFDISPDHSVKEIEGLNLPRPSFPRHAAFVQLKDRLQLYVLLQDVNTVLVYKAEYAANGGMTFFKEDDIPLVKNADGSAKVNSEGDYLKASHLAISPDSRFLMVSSRGDNAHRIPSPFSPHTEILSDSIFTYSINQETGSLSLVGQTPSGGSIPRQFSLNATGERIAIVSQRNGWVSIFERDVMTGKIGKLLAAQESVSGPKDRGPVCILWDSPKAENPSVL